MEVDPVIASSVPQSVGAPPRGVGCIDFTMPSGGYPSKNSAVSGKTGPWHRARLPRRAEIARRVLMAAARFSSYRPVERKVYFIASARSRTVWMEKHLSMDLWFETAREIYMAPRTMVVSTKTTVTEAVAEWSSSWIPPGTRRYCTASAAELTERFQRQV